MVDKPKSSGMFDNSDTLSHRVSPRQVGSNSAVGDDHAIAGLDIVMNDE